MNCKSCGSMLEPGEKFCKKCGTPVSEPQATTGMVPPAGIAMPNPETNNMGMGQQAPVQPVQQVAPAQPMMGGQAPMQPQYQQPAPMQPQYQQPAPMQQQFGAPQKKNSMGIIIIVAVVAVVAIVAVIFLTKNKDSGNGGGDTPASNGGDQPVVTTNTTKVKYNGFVFDVSDDFEYEVSGNNFIIGDKGGTWAAKIELVSVPYDKIKSQKATVRSNFTKQGVKSSEGTVKSYGGLEFVAFEISQNDGKQYIIGYAKANNSVTYGVTAITSTFRANYDVLSNAGTVLKTGKYEGGSSYITAGSELSPSKFLTDVK